MPTTAAKHEAAPKVAVSVRRTMTFTGPQVTFLRDKAASLGISVSDLVRRIIDQYRDNN